MHYASWQKSLENSLGNDLQRSCKFVKSAEMKTQPASSLPLGAVHTSGAETTEHTVLVSQEAQYIHTAARRKPTNDL